MVGLAQIRDCPLVALDCLATVESLAPKEFALLLTPKQCGDADMAIA